MPERAAMSQPCTDRGTIVYMTPSQRRPRISNDLAARIDELRQESPFESYIEHVLERHADFWLGDETTRDRVSVTGRRLHSYTDQHGGNYEIGTTPPDDPKDDGALAVLYMHDEEMDNPLVARMTEGEVRAMRDLCTDILGEYEGR